MAVMARSAVAASGGAHSHLSPAPPPLTSRAAWPAAWPAALQDLAVLIELQPHLATCPAMCRSPLAQQGAWPSFQVLGGGRRGAGEGTKGGREATVSCHRASEPCSLSLPPPLCPLVKDPWPAAPWILIRSALRLLLQRDGAPAPAPPRPLPASLPRGLLPLFYPNVPPSTPPLNARPPPPSAARRQHVSRTSAPSLLTPAPRGPAPAAACGRRRRPRAPNPNRRGEDGAAAGAADDKLEGP